MSILSDIIGALGSTLRSKRRGASKAAGCTIPGKAALTMPDRSAKDPAALLPASGDKSAPIVPGRVSAA